jgi:hypothetical protein
MFVITKPRISQYISFLKRAVDQHYCHFPSTVGVLGITYEFPAVSGRPNTTTQFLAGLSADGGYFHACFYVQRAACMRNDKSDVNEVKCVPAQERTQSFVLPTKVKEHTTRSN